MNRRDSLKAIGLGTLSTGLLLGGCKPKEKKQTVKAPPQEIPAAADPGRQSWEEERDKALQGERFFTPAEMATITVLVDIIIPKDDVSGSATDAKVPEFIEFIVKDITEHQLPIRGGLRWLDMQCLTRYNAVFTACTQKQQLEMIDRIAYPRTAKPDMQQGVSFFNRMRDLTATGFFTSEMGMLADLRYAGNTPNQWTGVPADVLKQYGLEDVKI
ncbi:gluconate 2-dehydrogenase subunit 3 family protein [Mucilaginibacter hurinus]|uniref:Gluconate 2-dehydrogenase subunit 3 family protein n=1 Tax=Mucilaginibacter hurinus TaxID=2201324 RepID=A0A367GQE0_9SPHI|nr:gluconate 2-dehydrogenase subunit 3 family protein [Mucilaginibacter hurinus]RCH55677.1 gluconate 2-dehydrogenase subunit 3 family protein [Mucilaginibacter hurinus]